MRYTPHSNVATCMRCGWQFTDGSLARHEAWCRLEVQVLRDIRRRLFEMTHGAQVLPDRVVPCRTINRVFHVTVGPTKYIFYADARELVAEDDFAFVGSSI